MEAFRQCDAYAPVFPLLLIGNAYHAQGMGNRPRGLHETTEMRLNANLGETGRIGIDTEHRAQQFDVRTGTPCMTIAAGIHQF